eukprot:791699-Prorocentrum_minimum.AAC.1
MLLAAEDIAKAGEAMPPTAVFLRLLNQLNQQWARTGSPPTPVALPPPAAVVPPPHPASLPGERRAHAEGTSAQLFWGEGSPSKGQHSGLVLTLVLALARR